MLVLGGVEMFETFVSDKRPWFLCFFLFSVSMVFRFQLFWRYFAQRGRLGFVLSFSQGAAFGGRLQGAEDGFPRPF